MHLLSRTAKRTAAPTSIEVQTPAGLTRLYWLTFGGFLLFYLSLSPLSVEGMGYMSAFRASTGRLVSNLGSWLTFQPALEQFPRPHHGILESILHVPFVAAGRLLFGPSQSWADRMMALEPVLAVSVIVSLIFVWVHRITGSLKWAAMLTGIAAFTTMLWPYAYIGMETNQSLFVFLAAFLALAPGQKIRRGSWIGFALCVGLAIGLKISGVVLVPAAVLLVAAFHRRQREIGIAPKSVLRRTAGTVLIVAALYTIAAVTRPLSPTWSGGMTATLAGWTVPPLLALLNAFALFFSSNKGLLMYCPVTLLSLVHLPKAWREDRLVTGFAVLTLGGLVAGFAPLFFFTEDSWGPRYLLPSVAPLIVCLALAVRSAEFRLTKIIPTLVLACWGVFVSFLGMFFYYDSIQVVAVSVMGRSLRLEQLQHSSEWNPILFNSRLLELWTRGGPRAPDTAPIYWPPNSHIWGGPWPDLLPPPSQVDIRPWAVPQPFLFRAKADRKFGSGLGLWIMCLASLILGASTLVWVVVKAFKETPILSTGPPETSNPEPLDRLRGQIDV
jgi:hypothetical protein